MIVTQDDVLEILRKIKEGNVFDILYELHGRYFNSVSSEYINISQKLIKLSKKGLITIDRSKKAFIYSIIE